MYRQCPVIRRRVVSPCVGVSSRFLEHSVDDRAQALTLPHGSSEPLDPSLFFPLQPYHHAVTLQWQQPERLEPWLSSCRAVEAPSRHCRGAVEALSRRCRGLACRACRVTVEFLSSLSSLTPCAWASSSVEVCRGLSSSCRAVEQCRADE